MGSVKKTSKATETSPFVFILPTLVLIGIFTLYPFFYAIYISLVKYVIYEPQSVGVFAGLENYVKVLNSTFFFESFINTLIYTAASVVTIVGCGLGIALILNQQLKGSNLVRMIMLIPWAIPPAAAGLLWRFMFQSFGWVNKVMVDLGIWQEPIYFLSAPRWMQILFAVIAQMWWQLPFAVILIYAVLQLVPREIIDSAEIDGAIGASKLKHITLPYLKSAIALVAAFEAIIALTMYDIVYTFAGGTYGLISYYAFASMFQWGDFGQGSALAVILAIMTLFVILVILRIVPAEKLYRYSFTGE